MFIISRLVCLATIVFTMTVAQAGELKTVRPEVSNFSLNTLKGEHFEFKSLAGKVVILSFWASWCKPCIQELTYLKKLAAEYKETMEVVGVCTDAPNTMAGVRKIVKRKRLSMTIAMDTEGNVMNEMNPRGTLPFSAYIDRQGRIAATHDGFKSGDEGKIKAIVDALIAEKKITPTSETPSTTEVKANPDTPRLRKEPVPKTTPAGDVPSGVKASKPMTP